MQREVERWRFGARAHAGEREHRSAGRRARQLGFVGRAAEDRFHQHIAAHPVAPDEAGVAPVAQDRRSIGSAHDLFEPMCDDDDAVVF
jgi:hypothetical protein